MVNTPVGVILAGGRSTRMGGKTKALVELNGLPMIEHVIARLAPQVSSLLLSVEQPEEQFECFGLPQVADTRQGSQGPLGGLLAALEALPDNSDFLLLTPCDAPFLPLDLGHRLMQQLEVKNLPGCLVRYEGELQPTFSLWHKRLIPDLRRAVLEDRLGGFKQFLGRACLAIVDWEPQAVSPFFNINTSSQLEQAENLLSSDLES